MTGPLPSLIAALLDAFARLVIRRRRAKVARLEARLATATAQQQRLKGARS